MKYIWLTDTHFNFLSEPDLVSFYLKLEAEKADGIFLTGDVSTGPHLTKHLLWLEKVVRTPIYFVLGNHDYYRSSFTEVENKMTKIMQSNENIRYLSVSEPISLTKDVALVGHDGWYDARWRDPITPFIFIWDWYFVKDFRALFGIKERLDLVRERALLAAEFIEKSLQKAFESHSTVYMLTHFPPWPEVSNKYYGLIEKFWMPYNSSKIMSDYIERVMVSRPDKNLVILAGHTHIKRTLEISPNIKIIVGDAEFGKPQIQDILIIK